jgi:hypothetical protein
MEHQKICQKREELMENPPKKSEKWSKMMENQSSLHLECRQRDGRAVGGDLQGVDN